MNYEWAWKTSDAAFQRAIELNPKYATAHQWYSASLLCRSRLDEALASAEAELALDPLSSSVNATLGWVLHFSRRYDEAIEQYQKTLQIDPGFFPRYHFLTMSYEQKGLYDEAIAACRHVGSGQRRLGLHVCQVRTQGQGKKISERDAAAPRDQVCAGLRSGYRLCRFGANTIRPSRGCSEACDERSTSLTIVRPDPRLDDLRAGHRFETLLRRIGLA